MCFESLISVTSLQAQIPHGDPGGIHSHGHSEVDRVHIGQNFMPGSRIGQGQFQFWWGKIIDSFHISSRIPPNMFTSFALPRIRRPKPASHREGRVFLVWMMEE
jgi:hypothetical protein